MISADRKKLELAEIELRESEKSDSEFLKQLYFSRRKDEFSMFGWSEEQIKGLLEMQFNAQNQSYNVNFPNAEHSIIRSKTENIGRMIVDRNSDAIHLVDIVLLQNFRNLGIGSKLIADLIEEAKKENLPLNLQVARENLIAQELYRKLGFKVTSENEMNFSMSWKK